MCNCACALVYNNTNPWLDNGEQTSMFLFYRPPQRSLALTHTHSHSFWIILYPSSQVCHEQNWKHFPSSLSLSVSVAVWIGVESYCQLITFEHISPVAVCFPLQLWRPNQPCIWWLSARTLSKPIWVFICGINEVIPDISALLSGD